MDKRSRKIIVVTHCILNQNARLDDCAIFKGAIPELVNIMISRGYGIFQLPCPEMAAIDFKRSKRSKKRPYIRDILELPLYRKKCRAVAEYTAVQIKDYLKNGFYIPAVLGKDGSPACGVTGTSVKGVQVKGTGVFIEELRKSFKKHKIKTPIIGMSDHSPEQLKKITGWLKKNLK